MLAVVVSLLLISLSSPAGMLTSGLSAAYSGRGADETVPVLISLSDRVATAELAGLLAKQGFSQAEIHNQVMSTLEGRAASTQAAVLKSMDILKTSGMARNVRTLWLSNLIAADMTRAAAELVANMAEVSEVGLDEDVALRRVIETTSAQGTPNHVESTLAKLNVTELWRQGLRGEDRVVCLIGDGADIYHPALASHWRGRNAPLPECWYEPGLTSGAAACGPEGTFAAGLLCGADSQTGDTLGAAPAASWIAAKLFCENKARLSDVLLAVQWAVDPDGDPGTFGDVPDAICNLWGADLPCTGAGPSAAWEALENVEMLGPVMVFAASNTGQDGPGSVKAPESHAALLAVGNVDAGGSSFALHRNSGRGPSPCDPNLVKPDVVAPGALVRTSGPSGYVRVTGTGPAAAYVAGTIALVRQANPNLSAAQVKQALLQSARDQGSPGADNGFGYGVVDAAAAVKVALAQGRAGAVEGVVRYGGVPVSGARVRLSSSYGELSATTAGGVFRFDHVPAGRSYAVAIGRFGFKYFTRFDSVLVEDGRITTLYLNLERGFEDDAENDQGWSLGVAGDNATGGTWVRAVPIGARASGKPVQPEADASLYGDYCFVTGNAANTTADAKSADVDGGRTTLRSPLFSLTELSEPVLHFAYWYSNDRGSNPGSDFFRVQISNDGGTTWTNVINTAASTHDWQKMNVTISDFVAPSDRMLLQFVAEDAGPGSLVEAAVDDISITGSPTVPEPPRDLTLDVQADQVLLKWRKSPSAKGYNVYLLNDPDAVPSGTNLFRTVTDTTLTVPMSEIPYDEFYFQVTADK